MTSVKRLGIAPGVEGAIIACEYLARNVVFFTACRNEMKRLGTPLIYGLFL
jgi:hypothetical protein